MRAMLPLPDSLMSTTSLAGAYPSPASRVTVYRPAVSWRNTNEPLPLEVVVISPLGVESLTITGWSNRCPPGVITSPCSVLCPPFPASTFTVDSSWPRAVTDKTRVNRVEQSKRRCQRGYRTGAFMIRILSNVDEREKVYSVSSIAVEVFSLEFKLYIARLSRKLKAEL